MNSTILLTGASGFVGRRLAQALIQENSHLICPGRQPAAIQGADCPLIADLSPTTDWRHCLHGVQTVIHCAARVHVMQESARDPLPLFRTVNVAGTLRLAEQAAASGVSQFIFLSSVKVNGEKTTSGKAFTEDCAPQPIDPYGISKYEAEQALLDLGRQTGMAITIIRPPLVYGPGVGANFLSMLKWVKRGIPLPLGSIRNKRSFVFIDNLVSLIICCIQNPQASNQVFLASDGQDLSTTDLLTTSAAVFGVTSRLLPCPPGLLMFMAKLAGKKSAAERLCQSLQVDIHRARGLLGWTPPYTVEQGLQATVNHILAS
jgi:nucleoside-diphosphate-sugar epimerase